MQYACLFEAKSIQEYILRSGRMRHLVGASELIDSLTTRLLDGVLAAMEAQDEVQFSRRAGGAVYLFTSSKSVRDAFLQLWSLAVRQYAPNLEFIIVPGEGASAYEAYRDALQAMQAARNRQASVLPTGTPITRYVGRTGLPAVKDSHKGLEDAASRQFGQHKYWGSGGLVGRFAPASRLDVWPRDLSYGDEDADAEHGAVFPFLENNRYLGLLHADGNGLGQLLMTLGEHVMANPDVFVELFRDVSEAIEQATCQAATQATTEVLEPVDSDVYPARPLVLGGDDLTILVRADLAVPFACAFMHAFETFSREKMAQLKRRYPDVKGLPDALTAGAGIVFIKSNHPFYMAHELVDALAKHAKDRAKEVAKRNQTSRIPPALAFYRITTASHGDYEDIRKENTFGTEAMQVISTLGAYSVDTESVPGLPALGDLDELARILGDARMARGPARQILTLLGADLHDARRRYARWREILQERGRDDAAFFMLQQRLQDVLQRLCGGELDPELPISSRGKRRETPLGDVATWLAIQSAPLSAREAAQEPETAV